MMKFSGIITKNKEQLEKWIDEKLRQNFVISKGEDFATIIGVLEAK